jgi:hypothetical protein
MMDRGMALVSERQILKRDRDWSRRDGDVHASAHTIVPQRRTETPATTARRVITLAPSREIAECR